jgi:hypothetical protein
MVLAEYVFARPVQGLVLASDAELARAAVGTRVAGVALAVLNYSTAGHGI